MTFEVHILLLLYLVPTHHLRVYYLIPRTIHQPPNPLVPECLSTTRLDAASVSIGLSVNAESIVVPVKAQNHGETRQ